MKLVVEGPSAVHVVQKHFFRVRKSLGIRVMMPTRAPLGWRRCLYRQRCLSKGHTHQGSGHPRTDVTSYESRSASAGAWGESAWAPPLETAFKRRRTVVTCSRGLRSAWRSFPRGSPAGTACPSCSLPPKAPGARCCRGRWAAWLSCPHVLQQAQRPLLRASWRHRVMLLRPLVLWNKSTDFSFFLIGKIHGFVNDFKTVCIESLKF